MLLLSPDLTSSKLKYVDVSVRFERIKHVPPAKIRRWEDSKSNARGVLVINSLSSGSARGYIKVSESKSLSKATQDARTISKMIEVESDEYGGACAVLVFNPNDSKLDEIKDRFKDAVFKDFNLKVEASGEFIIKAPKNNNLFEYFAKKLHVFF